MVSRLRPLLSLLLVAALILPTKALYFYMDSNTPKCFFEELPKDTLVVGHYSADVYNSNSRTYAPSPDLGIYISVEETFDNDHRVVSQRGSSTGRFTFTAADSGQHRLCFTPSNAAQAGGWLSGGSPPAGAVRFTLDLVIGETSQIESTDKGKIQDIVQRVKDLNGRLQDIRREQVFQREREAEFRDQSESTNARVVRWSLIQLAVLGVTCAWQLSHLRAFFIKQKLT
ncbi:transmembrane emp24 domain-containing protein 9 [Lineolata rhizophorae]|uniref:Transmembrane emp24 domain-containing protein 9 n=1 Tax=Lineolata rhizophorae TaxID=578093 RepID=A0A6A6PC33_9PEZI|nr:transmembrane emp24 domain-containing protein 9 [Lineolata rhizophorae]